MGCCQATNKFKKKDKYKDPKTMTLDDLPLEVPQINYMPLNKVAN